MHKGYYLVPILALLLTAAGLRGGANSYTVSSTVALSNNVFAFRYNVKNTSTVPIWLLVVHLNSAPNPSTIVSPNGWQAIVVPDADSYAIEWATQGPGGIESRRHRTIGDCS